MLYRITMSAFAILSIVCASVSAAESGESVAYRAKEWKSLHVENEADVQRTIDMLKKLGCETRLDQHNGHSDVTFRSPEWKEVTLDSHENADQWEQWLTRNGFQTLHGHDHVSNRDAIVVQYGQTEWQAQHFEDERQAAEFMAMCKGLGCEVRKDAHSGHIDVTYRCTSRRILTCVDHEDAHSLQAWLEKKGFQTEHVH
ncbi:MAG TPA: hypothetical protein PK992_05330 [Planctomycetaceae bacterium]|nr:hypothetical protein [Planctomycetaceae bacterium]